MLLHLTTIKTFEVFNKDAEAEPKVIREEMLIERDTIVRAFKCGSGRTRVIVRYPYGGSVLGYAEIDYVVEEPLKYIFSGRESDRVIGECIE